MTNYILGLQCAFTHHPIKAKALQTSAVDLCHVPGAGGRSTVIHLHSPDFAPKQTTTACPLSGWQQVVVPGGAASGALRQRKGEAGPGTSRDTHHGWGIGYRRLGGMNTVLWPEEHGWKLLGSSTAWF